MKAVLLTIGMIFLFYCVHAQQAVATKKPVDLPRPRNIKVLNEYKDKNGNIIRTVRYAQGLSLVTETVIIPDRHIMYIHVPLNPDTIKKDQVTLIVNKSQYCVEVFYRKKIIRVYKAVFGPKPLQDKCMEGDRCTPEGHFKIATKNPRSQYNKFLGLNYPNDSSLIRFNQLKEKGEVPKTAKMGGSIGIHGIWNGGDDMIELGIGWTDGCIALKNKDIDDLYQLVSVGTTVLIRR